MPKHGGAIHVILLRCLLGSLGRSILACKMVEHDETSTVVGVELESGQAEDTSLTWLSIMHLRHLRQPMSSRGAARKRRNAGC
jgi:hypothetical protein